MCVGVGGWVVGGVVSGVGGRGGAEECGVCGELEVGDCDVCVERM